MLTQVGNSICYYCDGERVCIQPWGKSALRVRAVKSADFPQENYALLAPEAAGASILMGEREAVITNGKITARISTFGKITFYDQNNAVLLKEFWRDDRVEPGEYDSSLEIAGREFKPIIDGDYRLTVRFEPCDGEKIFGMGQYQQSCLDLKGCDLELAHRNSQSSVPFLLSSRGYGFLWNNPAVGRVVFGKNRTTWSARSTKSMDYWICAGDSPREIEQQYAQATGKTPMMPDYAMGFWQCKLRYRTQEELLTVAREYKKRGLPLSVIVIDYFHWPFLGDFRFDSRFWPDPEGMVRELREMGVTPVVSIWPYVESQSENYEEMHEKGFLIHSEKGLPFSMVCHANSMPFDATNPSARKFVWQKVKKNYYDKGIQTFWLDEAEPEYTVYDFENYRYYLGPNTQVGNLYPFEYARGFYEGRREEGETDILNLIRCAWAGSQRFGTLVWSGDIHSSFQSLGEQVRAGLNMAVSGIPWWTTDIGGFAGGDGDDPEFRELLVRWFQYGTFCPVMRLHGNRSPWTPGTGTTGGVSCGSGGPNEIWSFGEDVYKILRSYLFIREALRPYITQLMEDAHTLGNPVMRPLFYEFPNDPVCWEIDDAYLFGRDILAAPVLKYRQRARRLYLPAGARWTDVWTRQSFDGGQWLDVEAPLSQLPLFVRDPFDGEVIRDAAARQSL